MSSWGHFATSGIIVLSRWTRRSLDVDVELEGRQPACGGAVRAVNQRPEYGGAKLDVEHRVEIAYHPTGRAWRTKLP